MTLVAKNRCLGGGAENSVNHLGVMKFVVVEESKQCGEGVPNCKATHWVCPFCGACGSTKEPVTEYFSVTCDEFNDVFLVHVTESIN